MNSPKLTSALSYAQALMKTGKSLNDAVNESSSKYGVDKASLMRLYREKGKKGKLTPKNKISWVLFIGFLYAQPYPARTLEQSIEVLESCKEKVTHSKDVYFKKDGCEKFNDGKRKLASKEITFEYVYNSAMPTASDIEYEVKGYMFSNGAVKLQTYVPHLPKYLSSASDFHQPLQLVHTKYGVGHYRMGSVTVSDKVLEHDQEKEIAEMRETIKSGVDLTPKIIQAITER